MTQTDNTTKIMTFSIDMYMQLGEVGRKLGMTKTNVVRYACKKLIDVELKNGK